MDTNQLRYFVTLYEARSMGRAAAELFISQQGLSRSVKALERELGVLLFERTPQGLAPTRAGEYFYDRVRPLTEQLAEACRNVVAVAERPDELRVPCIVGLHDRYDRVAAFQRESGVSVHWRECDNRTIERQVLSGEAPLGIAIGHQLSEDLAFEAVCAYPIVAMMRRDHPLASHASLSLAELRGMPLVMESGGYGLTAMLVDRCLAQGFEPHIVAESSEVLMCYWLVTSGVGVALIPDALASLDLGDEVRVVPLSDDGMVSQVGLVWRKDRPPEGAYARFARCLLG